MSHPEPQKLRDGLAWGQEAQTIINSAIKLLRDATTALVGLVRLATNAETTTGTATDIATTPAGVKAVIDALKAAALTISSSTTAGLLNLLFTDEGTGTGPIITLDRASASPAAADFLGRISFLGRDSGGGSVFYAVIDGTVIDPTDTSEDGELRVGASVTGAFTYIIRIANGVQIGTPTGGYQGVGTLNLDNALFKDGTQVVSGRRTGWAATTGTEIRTNFGDASLAETSQALRALVVDLKAHGVIGA